MCRYRVIFFKVLLGIDGHPDSISSKASGAVAPLERVMKRFVMRQNIAHYRALLNVTTDPSQRRSIEQLLHEGEAKLKKYDDDNKKNRPAPARRLNQSRFSSLGSLAKFVCHAARLVLGR